MNYLEYLECFYLHIENIKKIYLKKINIIIVTRSWSLKKMHVGGPGDLKSIILDYS